MGSDIEAIKEYLRDLRETTLDRDDNNKEKALMHLEPYPSYSPPRKELPPPLPKWTEEVEGRRTYEEQRKKERVRENQKDLQYH